MHDSEIKYTVVATEKVEDVFTANLLENRILEVYFNPDLVEVDVHHLQMLFESIKKLGQGKKMLQYFTIAPFLNITPEGRAYSASSEAQVYTLANAVLVNNLAQKIGFNFFLNFNKPPIPIKAFSKKEEAFEWLLSFNEKA